MTTAAAAGAGTTDPAAGAAAGAAGAAGGAADKGGAAGAAAGAGAGDTGKAGGTGGSTSGDAAAGTAGSKAPDKYELKLSQGSRLEESDVKDIERAGKEAGWTNEQAQAVLAEYEGHANAKVNGWLEASKADKQIGGDNFQQTETLANAAITKLRPEGHARRDGFMRLIGASGYGKHPEVLAFLADIGKLFAEDSPAGGGAGTGGAKAPVSPARKLYGTD